MRNSSDKGVTEVLDHSKTHMGAARMCYNISPTLATQVDEDVQTSREPNLKLSAVEGYQVAFGNAVQECARQVCDHALSVGRVVVVVMAVAWVTRRQRVHPPSGAHGVETQPQPTRKDVQEWAETMMDKDVPDHVAHGLGETSGLGCRLRRRRNPWRWSWCPSSLMSASCTTLLPRRS